MPGFDVLWPDQDRFRYRGWAAEGPKRYLAGAIVVGTIDQVLLSSLMVGHAHLRATALLRHLLVVDEVHASDVYMTRILESVLARHVRAGGHALLLSATLAAEARQRLLLAATSQPRSLTLEESVSAPYPMVSSRNATSTAIDVFAVTHDGRARSATVELSATMEDPPSVAARAAAAARAGAKVLVLRNTVADCVATQLEVEAQLSEPALLFACGGRPAPHHGRFARDDRQALDVALEQRLGKERPDGGCVVVATQTVQQSLDIDADLLITDLCPIDVLLQRIGRLHRHLRRRPAGIEVPLVIVLVPESRDLTALVGKGGRPRNHHGLGSVYQDLRVLEATWSTLEQERTWRIPAMSRELVERCLHSASLAATVERLGPAFREHEQYLLGEPSATVASRSSTSWTGTSPTPTWSSRAPSTRGSRPGSERATGG
ncbi:MAG: CRISPR-associated helicase Cas3' [Myxococcales bacterium]